MHYTEMEIDNRVIKKERRRHKAFSSLNWHPATNWKMWTQAGGLEMLDLATSYQLKGRRKTVTLHLLGVNGYHKDIKNNNICLDIGSTHCVHYISRGRHVCRLPCPMTVHILYTRFTHANILHSVIDTGTDWPENRLTWNRSICFANVTNTCQFPAPWFIPYILRGIRMCRQQGQNAIHNIDKQQRRVRTFPTGKINPLSPGQEILELLPKKGGEAKSSKANIHCGKRRGLSYIVQTFPLPIMWCLKDRCQTDFSLIGHRQKTKLVGNFLSFWI